MRTFATWLEHSVPSHAASSSAALCAVGAAWPAVTKGSDVAACPCSNVRARGRQGLAGAGTQGVLAQT